MSLQTTLTALQASAVSLMQVDSFFNGSISTNSKSIPIITEQKGGVQDQILTCLGSVGICALVMTPVFEFHSNLAQDLSGWALLTVTIFEDAMINQTTQGTGIFGIALAERIVAILHWAQHGVPTGPVSDEITAATRFLGISRPIEFISDGPPLQYNVGFQAHVTLNPQFV